MVERTAHNGFVVGSNPARLIFTINLNCMEITIKKYKYLKIKTYFKNSNFFLIYNGTNMKNFIEMDQKLKKLDLTYYKVYNKLTKKVLKDSIYKNYHSLASSLIIIIKPKSKFTNLTFNGYLSLDDSLNLLAIKVNNKIYTLSKINSSLQLNHKNDNLILTKVLKSQLKLPYKLTQKISK